MTITYYIVILYIIYIFVTDFIYFEREGKGERKGGRETSMCVCLSCIPYWGPGPQPRHET